MVVVKSLPTKAAAVLAAVAICNTYSCKKYEEGPAFTLRTKKMRLTGEWELDKIILQDGTVYTSYNIEWEFEKDGDFKQTYVYSYYGSSYVSTENGDWEWEDGKENIEIQVGSSVSEYEIIRLTNKELIVEDDYSNEYEFEKQ
jgi:hypothetical protein